MQNLTFDTALEAWRSDDIAETIRLCRALLQRGPRQAQICALLAQALSEGDDLSEANALSAEAVRLAPDDAMVRIRLSAVLERQGDTEKAAAEVERACELQPKRFEAWARLGELRARAGNFSGASIALSNAAQLNPQHPGIALRLAIARLEAGEPEGALSALNAGGEALGAAPEGMRLKTHIMRTRRDWPGVEQAAAKWLSATGDAEARVALAFGLTQQGLYARASEIYRPLVETADPSAEHLAGLGRILLGARDIVGAEALFQRAIAKDAKCAEAAFGLARLSTFVGLFDAAEFYCREALKADNTHAEAFGQLAEVTGGRLSPEEFAALERLCADESVPAENRAIAHFARGDCLHRARQRAAAFAAWDKANAIKAALAARESDPAAQYDRTSQERAIQRQMDLFARDPAAAEPLRPSIRLSEVGESAPVPIFIIGMPRSGTTLLESALSAHEDVWGGGELSVLPFIHKDFTRWAEETAWRGGAIPNEKVKAWRAKYFVQCKELGWRGEPYTTDKQPANFVSAGLIRSLFPEARIIHIRRNPLETGFSIYRRNFSQQWPFAHAQGSIAHFYGQYARLTAHWAGVLGHALAFVQYETLVADFESELRRLVDYCGLSWSNDCLEFYKVERPVITFSATQVRKPPSADHLNSTDPYAEFLSPLREGLASAGVDLETGAMRAALPRG